MTLADFGLDAAIFLCKALQGGLRFGRGACNEAEANLISEDSRLSRERA